MKRKLLPRIFITLLGIALILWAAEDLTLGLFGERADAVPNRYTYNISYTFTLPDGTEIDGFTKKIDGAAYIKADGTGKIAVRYFKAMPYLNAPEKSPPFSFGQLILTAAGILLIARMNLKRTVSE